jgi:hypothetical protein
VLTMVRAMAPIVNVVWLDAEHTFHPADNAADRGANHGPDWPSDATAFMDEAPHKRTAATQCHRAAHFPADCLALASRKGVNGSRRIAAGGTHALLRADDRINRRADARAERPCGR